jgi:hypothetical protein
LAATLIDVKHRHLIIRQLLQLIEWQSRWTFSGWRIRQDSFNISVSQQIQRQYYGCIINYYDSSNLLVRGACIFLILFLRLNTVGGFLV